MGGWMGGWMVGTIGALVGLGLGLGLGVSFHPYCYLHYTLHTHAHTLLQLHDGGSLGSFGVGVVPTLTGIELTAPVCFAVAAFIRDREDLAQAPLHCTRFV